MGFSHYEVTGGYSIGMKNTYKKLYKAIDEAHIIYQMTKKITGHDVNILIVSDNDYEKINS